MEETGLLTWAMAQSWWMYVASTVAIATAVTAILPSTWKDNKFYGMFMKLINFLAGAIARGKPADAK